MEKLDNRKIKIGDNLYDDDEPYAVHRYTVVDIQHPYAIFDSGHKIHLKVENENGGFFGSSTFSNIFWKVETDELIEKYRKSEMITKIQESNLFKLSIEELKNIIKIIDTNNAKTI